MKVRIKAEGNRVVVIVDGKTAIDAPWEKALDIQKAIYQKAREAEEHAKAEQIIYDHAMLTRGGFPVGLTSRPDMMAEVAKEAAWNTTLRRAIRPMMGVASQAVVATPTIIREPDVTRMTQAQRLSYLRKRYPTLRINQR